MCKMRLLIFMMLILVLCLNVVELKVVRNRVFILLVGLFFGLLIISFMKMVLVVLIMWR